MSKRFFPQQQGERKKAKLDVTISDHNFPLSQNSDAKNDNWGDDNEDELLLMASQECEQAYHNNSTLPDFSLCMQPGATSTQMFSQPSTSKAEFHFKKPTINSPQLTSTHLKDKCNRISSPLPGMSSKISQVTTNMKYNDDLIYNDKVFKEQDSDHIYRQLLQMQEENVKLKSENGKLLDKCVTKEGEASILRTQLKSCQVAVDNARMEKIKAQEKVQMEWSEKLSVVSGQMHDLRTQLDFKNLEIISIKEKCRMLESSKVKLTQVTVPSHDISSSQRHNNISSTYNALASQRRLKVASSGAQTDSRTQFLKLNKTSFSAPSRLTPILPLMLEPTSEQPSLLDYNEKLRTDLDESQHNCRVFSTFHLIPATPAASRHRTKSKATIGCIHEDLIGLANGTDLDRRLDKIVKATSSALSEVRGELQAVCARATTAFLRQMDERYIEAAGAYLRVPRATLLAGGALYKEEQAILARRMVAILAHVLDPSTRIFTKELLERQTASVADGLLLVISDICTSLDTASCATLYSGLVCSITLLLETLPANPLAAGIVKTIVACRPMPFALCRLLAVLRKLAAADGLTICVRSGNMRIDFEQGVLLYKKDSCHFHVLLKQVEVALKCIEKQKLVQEALTTTQNLLAFYNNYSAHINLDHDNRCDCQLVLMQVIVYALKICSVMMDECELTDGERSGLLAACRGGAALLLRAAARDAELAARLGLAEGHYIQFCERLRARPHPDLYENMLLELAGTYQCAAEDTPPSYHRQAWVKSFAACSLAD